MKGTVSNMAKVQDKPTFEILPIGEYVVEIAERSEKDTKNGDLMVNLTLEVTSGPHKGKKVWDNIIICDNPDSPAWKIRWRLKQFLKAIDEPHHGDSFEWDTDRWLWRRCKVNVGHELWPEGTTYAGQPKPVIKQYSPLPEHEDIVTAAAPAKAKSKKVFEGDTDIPF